MLHLKEIGETNQFFELRQAWNKILETSKDQNVFVTWEFLSTCWKHFGDAKKLRIITVEDEDETIAIAPFKQSRYSFRKTLGYTVIEPLGYGTSDYTGLVLNEKMTECFQLILNYLAEDRSWDFIYLYDLPGTSRIPELLSKNFNLAPRFEVIQGGICPFISLTQSEEDFAGSLNSNFRRDLLRCQNKLEKDYRKVELLKYNELGSIENGVDIFFELHQQRWKSKLKNRRDIPKAIRQFYVDISTKYARNGWLALYFLVVKGKPIAAQYCIEYKKKMYNVLGGFDPAYSRYSPGNLLTLKIVNNCIQKEIVEYDFMKGGESYKFRWSKEYRRNVGIRFVNSSFTSNLYNRGIELLKRTRVNRIFAN